MPNPLELTQKIRNLDAVLAPKSIAVIGASREPNKIGHVIVKNFIDGGFLGKIYPVNPNAAEVLGRKCYPSITAIPDKVESAVIAIPAALVPSTLEECGRKGVRGVVIVSGGFSEVGNTAGEALVKKIADKHAMAVIGTNCMGVLNPASRVDSIFLPIYKLGRPHVGDISFISQSGAVGGCIVDLAARAGIGMAKFVSYGNATAIDESDLLVYLAHDPQTKIIIAYLEGVHDGKRFLKIAREVTRQKPVIILKAGVSTQGAAAAKSHTGSLAGSALAYTAAFKQSRVVQAHDLDELFHLAKMFEQPPSLGKRVAVVTNGGGNGVLAADAIEENGLTLAKFSDATLKGLKQFLPTYATARNPLDLIGDANSHRYEQALNLVASDPNVDAMLVIVLFQTAAIDSSVVNVIVRHADSSQKPLFVAATGGEYTEMHRRIFDSYGVPTYRSTHTALKAYAKYVKYCEWKKQDAKKK